MKIFGAVIAVGFLVIALVSEPLSAATQEPVPPPKAWGFDGWTDEIPSTVQSRISTKFSLGSFQGVFWKTPLNEVLKKAKNGVVFTDWSVHGFPSSLCYSASPKSGIQNIWLSSDGEMGDGSVDSMIVQSVADSGKDEICPALPPQMQPIIIDNNLKLGMTKAELIRQIGPVSKESGEWLIFHHGKSIAGSDCEEWDFIFVQMRKGRAVMLNASSMDAC